MLTPIDIFLFFVYIRNINIVKPTQEEAKSMAATKDKKEKRVACLYRVSTKGQVDKNDIPLQKNTCREFIANQPNWRLVKEYYEKGVSGYRLSADERDVLQQVKEDALNGLFDVLLVFMFDRLGRRDDETPFIVEWFVKQGIEVWSTQEGQQRFDDHIDKLMNYLRFWQSSGESYKTSVRVDNSHQQMVKRGLYRGGSPPYGYKLINSGIVNKKGKELKTLAIDEEQSKVIHTIYNLVLTKGYGANRITKYLNKHNIPAKNGGKWNTGSVNYILRNPIYKGYISYGKNRLDGDSVKRTKKEDWILSEKPIEELIIIPEEQWDMVQNIRAKRDNNKGKNTIPNTKSPLLLTGYAYCGHCGSPLTTTYNYRKWTNVDGTERVKIIAKYRCSGKALNKTDCDGQTIYAQKKVEDSFHKTLKFFINNLQQIDFEEEIIKRKQELDQGNVKTLKKLQKQNEENYQELSALNAEVAKSIMGKSSFKPELLSQLIEQKEEEIQNINKQIQNLEKKIHDTNQHINSLKKLREFIPVWWDIYNKLTVEEKKMMLSYMLDRVNISRDGIEIKFDVWIGQLLNKIGVYPQIKGEHTRTENTTQLTVLSTLFIDFGQGDVTQWESVTLAV